MLIQIVNGLVYGSFLYVLSVGLVLIFGLRGVPNFAHGALFMLGAYIAYPLASTGNFFVGLALAVAALAAIGVVLDKLVFKPLRNRDHLVGLLVTFGLLLLIEDGVRTVWGSGVLTVSPPPLLAGTVYLFGEGPYPVYRLFVVGVAVLVAVALSLWLRYTRTGLFVRAASVDAVTTGMQGVDENRLSAIVVAIGTGLAGLAGVVAAPLLNMSPTMSSSILINCFVVVVIGGLSSFSGTFVAAILIGLTNSFGIAYVPWAASILPFVFMVLVLLWRPEGLGGAKV